MLLWLGAICLVLIGGGIARRVAIPDAVIWCALGFGAAFLPGFDGLKPDPHLTMFLLLPPLVYSSAVRLPWREFRENLRAISLLSVGLVLVNTVAVAIVGHYLADLPWAVAGALGALISPTDPVAASAVAARVGLPHRLMAILEGEGLVNDAVALTVLRLAIAAAVTGHFSIGGGVARFLAILIGEPLYGCVVGAAILLLRKHIEDPRLEITVSLLTPFAAYLLPEHLGGSGILATVAAGMYVGERLSDVVPAGTRLHSTSVWEVVVFLLNGVLFLIAGMELRRVIRPEYVNEAYLKWGLMIAALVVVVRAGWCAGAWAVLKRGVGGRGARPRGMPARHMLTVAWAGMRGPISLAAALSIPAQTHGAHLPDFQALLFVTAIVIVVTLMVQGLALPYGVRLIGVTRDAEADCEKEKRQFALGEAEAAKAAYESISRLESEKRVPAETAEDLRRSYGAQSRGNDSAADARRIVIEAERARIHELRREGHIQERALKKLERNLDLRESELQ